MSTNRERLASLDAQYNSLQEQATALWNQKGVVAEERADLQIAIIKEEKLLAARKWTYHPKEHSDKSTFELAADGRVKDFPGLQALLKPDYHESVMLAYEMKSQRRRDKEDPAEYRHKLVELHFSDGDMYLRFDSDEVAQAFIKDFGIELDLSRLELLYKEQVAQVETTNKLLAQVKATLVSP